MATRIINKKITTVEWDKYGVVYTAEYEDGVFKKFHLVPGTKNPGAVTIWDLDGLKGLKEVIDDIINGIAK